MCFHTAQDGISAASWSGVRALAEARKTADSAAMAKERILDDLSLDMLEMS